MQRVRYPHEAYYFRQLLKKHHLNQRQAGRYLHLPAESIYLYYHGIFLPSPHHFRALIQRFHLNALDALRQMQIPLAQNKFGQEIKALRYSYGWSEQEVAKKGNFRVPGSIGNLELQDFLPTDSSIFRLCQVYHVNPVRFAATVYEERYHQPARKNNPGYQLMRKRFAMFGHLHSGIGLSSSVIKSYENNHHRKTTLRRVCQLSSAYQIPLNYVLKWFHYPADFASTKGCQLLYLAVVNGLSMQDLSQKLHVSKQMVNQYMSNTHEPKGKHRRDCKILFKTYPSDMVKA